MTGEGEDVGPENGSLGYPMMYIVRHPVASLWFAAKQQLRVHGCVLAVHDFIESINCLFASKFYRKIGEQTSLASCQVLGMLTKPSP